MTASTRTLEFEDTGAGATGEMIRRVQTFDWSATPLGPQDNWPATLRSAVRMLLASTQPMFIIWGRELTLIYNDRYLPIIGARHPAALGQPFREAWPELQADTWETIRRALAGEPVWSSHHRSVVQRNGFDEEVWYTFSHSPLHDAAGDVQGVICVVNEMSSPSAIERRLQFAVDLTDELRLMTNPGEITAHAAQRLGRFIGATRVGYAEIDFTRERMRVERDWTDGSAASLVGSHRISRYGDAVFAELSAGRTACITDVNADPRVADFASAYLDAGTSALLAVPLISQGQLTALLYVHQGAPRRWSDSDCVLAEDVAQRTWAALEQARAEHALRDSDDRLRMIQSAAGIGMIDIDLRSGAMFMTPEYLAVQGLPADAGGPRIYTEGWLERVHAEDRERVRAWFQRDMLVPGRFDREYRIIRPDNGETRWISNRGRIEADASGRPRRLLAAHIDITERKVIEHALRESEQRLRLALESSRMGEWSWDSASDGVLLSERAAQIGGFETGTSARLTDLLEHIHADDRARVKESIAAALSGGKPYDIECRVRRPGTQQVVWVAARGRALFDEAGRARGMIGLLQDITRRKESEEAEELLIREVDHRAKNVLAIVQSLMRLTPFESREQYTTALAGRIQSLARVHSLLSTHRWVSVSVEELVRGELDAYARSNPRRVTLQGPPAEVRPEAAQPLTFVLHELATNAAKYGALAAEQGELAVSWRWQHGVLELSWREKRAEPITAPTRSGFGSKLIDSSVRQFRGAIERHWNASGLTCVIRLGTNMSVAQSRSAERSSAPPAAPQSLIEGARVLVAEDEAAILMEVEEILRSAGAHIVGPAQSLEAALLTLLKEPIDCAVLDVNLHGELIGPVAQLLRQKGTPFVLLTGYEDARVESQYTLRKPVAAGQLISTLCDALAARSA